MRMRRVQMLPSLMTLGNALCGFGAVTLITKAVAGAEAGGAINADEMMWAGYLVLLAMVFDALDGRVARFARATSDFGGQLDSVADAVSFGVAPAFLMNRVVVEGLRDVLAPEYADLLRVAWICGGVYMGCALIRLARFNVENVHDEEAHMRFSGLPSPAAAGAVVSVIIVLATMWDRRAQETAAHVILVVLPLATLALGLLMVSRLRYSHLLNALLKGRRPISHLVLIVLGLLTAVLLRQYVLPLGFGGYALTGPVLWVRDRLGGNPRRRKGRGDAPAGADAEGQGEGEAASAEAGREVKEAADDDRRAAPERPPDDRPDETP